MITKSLVLGASFALCHWICEEHDWIDEASESLQIQAAMVHGEAGFVRVKTWAGALQHRFGQVKNSSCGWPKKVHRTCVKKNENCSCVIFEVWFCVLRLFEIGLRVLGVAIRSDGLGARTLISPLPRSAGDSIHVALSEHRV